MLLIDDKREGVQITILKNLFDFENCRPGKIVTKTRSEIFKIE